MSVSDAVLSTEDIKVELGGAQVLDIPSFSVKDKEVVTVVGPNGSGKTTLLLTLGCLLKPFSGRIVYRGQALDSHQDIFRFRRKISMVFQEPLLFDTTVYKNVTAGLKIRGLSKSESKERAMKYMKMLDIEHLATRSARKLSGGESQRASLARAFAIEPEIILLDEPFSALDPPTRHDLIHDLEKVVRATGTTTIMVTHMEFEALNLSGRIVVMNEGRIIQSGSPSMVMRSPSNEFVAKLVGMETVLNGRVLSCREGCLQISVSGKEMWAVGEARADEDVVCGIRPENVLIRAHHMPVPNDEKNVFAGRITHIYSMGPFIKLKLDCGFELVSIVSPELFEDLELAEGKQISAFLQPASVHLIPRE